MSFKEKLLLFLLFSLNKGIAEGRNRIKKLFASIIRIYGMLG